MGEQKQKNIHWFPGHMKKASNKIEEKIKLVDFVIVILDARAPYSSMNEYLLNLTNNKQKLYILNKLDLSDIKRVEEVINELKEKGNEAIGVSLQNNNCKKIIYDKIQDFCKEKEKKSEKKGIKNVVSRAMVIGIPNVGKSTFINIIANRKIKGTANTPGFTKSVSWAKVDKNFELLDTPGILEPSFKDKKKAINLALIGAIKETILPQEELANYLLDLLKPNYIKEINERYKINVNFDTDNYEIFALAAKSRGFLKKNNDLDVEKTEYIFLKEFKEGKIVKITLD